MSARTRRTASYAALGVLLSVVLLPLLASSPAEAAAKTITISLTANGPKPASVTAAIGDSVVFRNDDATFVHDVASASGPWEKPFDSGPLAPGQEFPAGKLAKAAEYVYRGSNLDTFTGKVVVPGQSPSAAPGPSRSTAPPPASSAPPAASSTGSPAPSTSPTAGTGVAVPPPLAGGFGSITAPGAPSPGGGPAPNVAPNVAPTLPGEDVSSPVPTGPAVAVGRGRLPEPPTGRRYGLPAALAAVAAAGVASLLIRLLLSHPAARPAAGGDTVVTVD